ncbi:MAG: hypothetical protein ACKN9P_05585 [Phenylobacterium sp.]
MYNYLELTTGRERDSVTAAAQALRAAPLPPVAVFAPLLGFASNTVLALFPALEGDAALAVTRAPGVTSALRTRLSPTARPERGAKPAAGGIYVHNWFNIDAGAVEEFVALSVEAWPDFEARFDARIFGLFLAEESELDRSQGARRLLLMTRYGDLGVWQASRDPTTEAMKIFARRRELTRVSLARSCTLLP